MGTVQGGPPCRVCTRTDAAEVNRALLDGVSYRDVAAHFDVHRSSTYRHARNCLGGGISERITGDQRRELADRLVAESDDLLDSAWDTYESAERSDDLRGRTGALRALSSALETVNRIAPAQDQQWGDESLKAVLMACMEVLAAHPRVRAEVRARLVSGNRGELADALDEGVGRYESSPPVLAGSRES